MRYRKGSYGLSASLDSSNDGYSPSRDGGSTPSRSSPGPPLSPPVGRKNSAQLSQPAVPEVIGLGSRENTNVVNVRRAPGVGLLRSFSVDHAQLDGKGLPRHREPSRTWTTPTKPRLASPMPLPKELVPTTITPKQDHVVKNGASRWRLLPFFRGESSHTTSADGLASASGELEEMSPSSIVCKPRKGDVICLGYDSLDDKAMRRLEGRSDHRPVVGSFAIYL